MIYDPLFFMMNISYLTPLDWAFAGAELKHAYVYKRYLRKTETNI